MRINKWLAAHTSLSRRSADAAIVRSRVLINGKRAHLGSDVTADDVVTLDDVVVVHTALASRLIMLHKPEGYVCSRNGQGSKTIYELLPDTLQSFDPVGRLDKDSSGLLLMTNNGQLLNDLAHPSRSHQKSYLVALDRPLDHQSEVMLSSGVNIGDPRPSVLGLKLLDTARTLWEVTLTEGRNRQIRRSFEAVECHVTQLHRTKFGAYALGELGAGKYKEIVVK